MANNETPQPPTEPEQEGIPDYADDTSTAYEDADRPRTEDSPSALPADEPQAVDEFGTTQGETRQGEPLEDRLSREEPDITAEETPLDRRQRAGRSPEEQAMHDVDQPPDQPLPERPADEP